MKLIRLFFILPLFFGVLLSCSSDDDGGSPGVELRDPEEVRDENTVDIESFLETHFFEFVDNPLHPNFQEFVFDTIAGENLDKEPIMDSGFLRDTTIIQQNVEYKLYYLVTREGNQNERKPKFADSTFVTYKGITIDNEVFDSTPNQIWLDLTTTVRGFTELLPKLRGSSGFVENDDGTLTYNDDFGIGVVFVPSGLAYFAAPPPSTPIRRYQPIIFAVQLYQSKESDHDRDGVPSYLEDLTGDGRVNELIEDGLPLDDTDENGLANYLDRDDDGDGVLTINEILIDENGNLRFLYLGEVIENPTEDDIPDHLNPDYPGEDA